MLGFDLRILDDEILVQTCNWFLGGCLFLLDLLS